MNREIVEQLLDRWIHEPAFREQLRRDPEGTVKHSGLKLDAEELAALRLIDWSLTDEELQARISKRGLPII